MRQLNQKGSFLIMFTLSFALLGTFIGFTTDFGRAYLQKARMNRLVDGAALAAAKVLQGQGGLEDKATRAACDSMVMNGASVEMTATGKCEATQGAPLTVTLDFLDIAVSGGPPIKHIQVTGSEPVPTTFLRFLSWMAPGDYSTINVGATAQAAPERPLDLMLILDRSGSMDGTDGIGKKKIASLKTAVHEFLNNNFTGNDRIGMTSFADRGCGNGSRGNSTAVTCTPDVPMDFTTSAFISTLKNSVNALVVGGSTNYMEAIHTVRLPLAQAFGDPNRATTRKAVLLVTDGKPTSMRRNSDSDCRQTPAGTPVTAWASGTYNSGCIQTALGDTPSQAYIERRTLGGGGAGSTTNLAFFQETISCIRSLVNCVTNGAMHEANILRNCGYNNDACSPAGNHDVLVFAIGIGSIDLKQPNFSFDRNAKCLLARIANANDILNTGNNTTDTINTVCANPPVTTGDGDTWPDLHQGWPCASGPCIDGSQQKGKVYVVDMKGDVEAQLRQVFNEVASILKLRLTI